MNKLSKLLLTGSLGAFLTACGPTIQGNFPDHHARGYEFRDRTELEEPYTLERAVIFGREFYVQRVQEREGNLPFVFLPFEEVSRIIDTNTGGVRLGSNKHYMPKRVRVEDFTTDEFADNVDLRMDTSPQGIRGVRADIVPIAELRRRAQAPPNSHGFSEVTTQSDARYGIRTITIFGEEYFFPHVAEDEMDSHEVRGREIDMLNFYLIPVKGSEIVIRNSDGRITLRNENEVYRPVLLLQNSEVEGSQNQEATPSQSQRVRGN